MLGTPSLTPEMIDIDGEKLLVLERDEDEDKVWMDERGTLYTRDRRDRRRMLPNEDATANFRATTDPKTYAALMGQFQASRWGEALRLAKNRLEAARQSASALSLFEYDQQRKKVAAWLDEVERRGVNDDLLWQIGHHQVGDGKKVPDAAKAASRSGCRHDRNCVDGWRPRHRGRPGRSAPDRPGYRSSAPPVRRVPSNDSGRR